MATQPRPGQAAEDRVPEISHEELSKRIGDPSLTILNVLPKEAWLDGRIPGSLNLPVAEIQARAHEVLPHHEQAIAVYCGGHT